MGTQCSLEVVTGSVEGSNWRPWTKIYPEDVNRKQNFDLPQEDKQEGVKSLRIVFEQSSDFFGRITVYDLQLMGNKLP